LTAPPSTPTQRRNALIAVAFATLIQVVAQLLIKEGTGQLPAEATLTQNLVGMFTILPLFIGFACYGLFTVIMVLALRHAELSMTFPILALSYVGVAAGAVVFRGEQMNVMKVAGIAVIVAGVAILGLSDKTLRDQRP
jgi:drug/metabolite transporter (DMT)-like permease